MDYSEKALALHREKHGKIETGLKVLLETKEDLSVAYTPGVAAACKAIAEDPKQAQELTIKRNTVAIVTDGSAVLGLGNIGPLAGLPVMEGKAALFKRFANVDAFPICLDTQNTEEIITAVKQIAPVFGGINLEDIAAPKCFEIEARLKQELDIPVMHDDQHGTAVVVLAALINALNLRELTKAEAKVVICGAGAAGIAIADLLLEYGFKHLTLLDSKGVLSKNRTDLNTEKLKLLDRIETSSPLSFRGVSPRNDEESNESNPQYADSSTQSKAPSLGMTVGSLADAVKDTHVFIGVSKPGLLTSDMVASMHERPIICALANPVPEIMPDVAKNAGAYIVATGRSDFPNQVNNVLAFPGIFRGALDNGVTQITNTMLVRAAEKLASLVEHPTPEEILPSPFQAGIATAIASAIH